MATDVTRRRFLQATGTGAAAAATLGTVSATAAEPGKSIKIAAVCCSPRKGKTTAQGLGICLEAAKAVAPDGIETELIELAGLSIPGQLAAGIPLAPGEQDDFPAIAEKLADPQVAGILIGTPTYFGNMSSLCKAFIDRCGVFRKKGFVLANRVGGVLAVGGVRNGGQELVIQSVQIALMCQEMLVVGDGRPTAHFGATLWNNGDDDISDDEFGVGTAKNLGRRVAEVALARNRT